MKQDKPESLFEQIAAISKPDEKLSDAATKHALKMDDGQRAFFDFKAGANWQKEKDQLIINSLLEALRPFADVAKEFPESKKNNRQLFAWNGIEVTYGDFRKAAALIKSIEDKDIKTK